MSQPTKNDIVSECFFFLISRPCTRHARDAQINKNLLQLKEQRALCALTK